MAEKQQCNFFLERKNRFCKMDAKQGNEFCGQHQEVTGCDNAAVNSSRMFCPLDSSHTCYVRYLQKHLKKCNANQKTPVYIVPGINRGSLEDMATSHCTLATIRDCNLIQLIDRIELICSGILLSVNEDISSHPALQKEIELQQEGINSKKQLSQVSSLLSLVEKFEVIQPNTCFIEFGAGRGMLTFWLGEIIGAVPQSSFLLVERAAYRHKFDGRVGNKQACTVRRVKADIGDLCLDGIDLLEGPQNLVALSKHLCGAATDMALRCITSSSEAIADKFNSIFIATCCHHRCDRSSYVGLNYLVEQGFEPDEFEVLLGITSWATCGKRKQEVVPKPEDSAYRYARLHLSQEKRRQVGRMCKLILDYGRIKFLRENGYSGCLTYYVPDTVSPENVCLIARKL